MRFLALLALLVVAGCAGNYKPPADGPTLHLKVQPDVKEGVPLVSYAQLTLDMYRLESPDVASPGTFIGWKKIPVDGELEPLVLPADRPLRLTMVYRSGQLFGPNLSGSQSYVLVPEPGATYVMKFWTDKQHFSVQVWREDEQGNLVAARAIPVN